MVFIKVFTNLRLDIKSTFNGYLTSGLGVGGLGTVVVLIVVVLVVVVAGTTIVV